MEKLLFAMLGVLVVAMMVIPPWLTRDIYPYNAFSLPRESIDKLAEDTSWQLDVVETIPGVRIPGLIHPASDSNAQWIFFIPGNGGGQLSSGQEYFLRISESVSAAKDWGMAVWGMRGFDGAGGAPDGNGFREDYLKLYQHLIDRYGVNPVNIHIVGFSFGTDLALFLSAALEEVAIPPATLTLLSAQGLTINKWKMRRREWFHRWTVPDSYDLDGIVNQIKMPVLIIESENDLVGDSSYLLDNIKGKKKYLVLENGNHIYSLKSPQSINAVIEWILFHQ